MMSKIILFLAALTFSLQIAPAWADEKIDPAPSLKKVSALSSFGYLKPTDALLQRQWFVMDQKARKLLDEGQIDEAEREWKQAAVLAENSGQIEPGLVNCLVGLSLLYHKKGDVKESERVYEYAMRNMEGLVGRDSIRFAGFLPDLAWLYHEHNRNDQAEILFKQHLDMHEKQYGYYSEGVLNSLDHYSRYLKKTGRLSEASMLEVRSRSIKDRNTP